MSEPREIRELLEEATALRSAVPGMPSEGPYPSSVGEVADEVVEWLDAMDRDKHAPGLAEEVRRRLNARGVWPDGIGLSGGVGGAPDPGRWDAGL